MNAINRQVPSHRMLSLLLCLIQYQLQLLVYCTSQGREGVGGAQGGRGGSFWEGKVDLIESTACRGRSQFTCTIYNFNRGREGIIF